MTRSTVLQNLNSLNVRLPSSVGSSVGVGYLNSESYTLSANFTFCHEVAPPSKTSSEFNKIHHSKFVTKMQVFFEKKFYFLKNIYHLIFL